MTDATNPLLQPSTLPYGLPDYRAIRAEHYLPAFQAGFDEQLREISRITMVRSMPTFENTIEALERSGELLDRVAHAFYTVSSADATPEIQRSMNSSRPSSQPTTTRSRSTGRCTGGCSACTSSATRSDSTPNSTTSWNATTGR